MKEIEKIRDLMFDEDEIGNMDSALQDGIENQLKLIEAALAKAEKDRGICSCPQERICGWLNKDTDKCMYGKI